MLCPKWRDLLPLNRFFRVRADAQPSLNSGAYVWQAGAQRASVAVD